MHARVGQLYFFAYESKLRYMRDSPEGAVKYSRQSLHRAAHPSPGLRQQNAATPTIVTTCCYYILRHIYWYYARCQWGNPNNYVIETTKCVFCTQYLVALFQNCWLITNDFVDDLSPPPLSLSLSVLLSRSFPVGVSRSPRFLSSVQLSRRQASIPEISKIAHAEHGGFPPVGGTLCVYVYVCILTLRAYWYTLIRSYASRWRIRSRYTMHVALPSLGRSVNTARKCVPFWDGGEKFTRVNEKFSVQRTRSSVLNGRFDGFFFSFPGRKCDRHWAMPRWRNRIHYSGKAKAPDKKININILLRRVKLLELFYAHTFLFFYLIYIYIYKIIFHPQW